MADAFRSRRERTVYRSGRSGARAYFGLRGQFLGTLIRHRSCSTPSRTVLAHAVAMIQATLLGALVARPDPA